MQDGRSPNTPSCISGVGQCRRVSEWCSSVWPTSKTEKACRISFVSFIERKREVLPVWWPPICVSDVGWYRICVSWFGRHQKRRKIVLNFVCISYRTRDGLAAAFLRLWFVSMLADVGLEFISLGDLGNGYSRWNFIPSCSATRVISTSNLAGRFHFRCVKAGSVNG
jgi:hypothetical protein